MRLKQIGNFVNVIDEVKQLGSISKLSSFVIKTLEASFKSLNAAQLLTRVSTMGLTDAQKLEMVQQFASDGANYQTVASLQSVSASQVAATGTTTGLSAAFTGLKATIVSIAPAILAITAASAALYAAYKYANAYDDALDIAGDSQATYSQTSR